MPRLIITEGASKGLERCHQFLVDKNAPAASRAGDAIAEAFELLEATPEIGRLWPDPLNLRELVISFGGSAYVALYHYEPDHDVVYVLAFRHQKEAGY